jgi:AcrR family transcriptional regulator
VGVDDATPVGEVRTDGRSARWEDHRSARRAHIVDAALTVLQRQPPGAEFHVRDVAEQAGLGRAVVYRHFADRAELDRAIQDRVLASLLDRVDPEVSLNGSIEQIIRRIVGAYVGWAAEHPALHRFAVSHSVTGEGGTGLERAVGRLGAELVELVRSGAGLLGIRLAPQDDELIDPLVFGIVGQVFASVRIWLGRSPLSPEADAFADHVARSIWIQLDGHARDRGVELDRETPLDDLLLGLR